MRYILSFLVIYAVSYVSFSFLLPTDDSDIDKWNRSGMNISIDAKTGCEYFTKGFGGITPRLNADGSHMGCKK